MRIEDKVDHIEERIDSILTAVNGLIQENKKLKEKEQENEVELKNLKEVLEKLYIHRANREREIKQRNKYSNNHE